MTREELLLALDESLTTSQEHIGQQKFNSENPIHLAAMTLSGRIFELATGVHVLAKAMRDTGIPYLLRGQMEVVFKLGFLSQDPINNYKSLHLKNCLEQKSALEKLNSDYDSVQSVIKKYNKLGVQTHSIESIFKQCGADRFYDLYKALSYICHGQLDAIGREQISKTEGKNQVTLLSPSQDLYEWLLTSSQLLELSSEYMALTLSNLETSSS